jgi:preprotein translocase subunit SecE
VARKVVDEPSEEVVANARTARDSNRGPFARLSLFVKQVFAELRKVVTPTRKELLNYTGVVLVFVVIMMGIVSVFDWAFGFVVLYLFGTPG